jgi:hypothetical protein
VKKESLGRARLACVALAFVNVYASLPLNVALAVFFAWSHSAQASKRESSLGQGEMA